MPIPHAARPRARAPGNHGRFVWTYIAAVWVAAALLLPRAADLGIPDVGSTDLRGWWPAVVVGFFLAEGYAVHIEFRGQALTLALCEIPLVLGLFFVSPLTLFAAQLAGSLVALAVRRRQRPQKMLFNLGQIAVRNLVALLTFDALLGGHPAIGHRGWAAALVAVLVEDTVGALLVGTVIFVTDTGTRVADLVRANLLDVAGTIGVATMTLSGVLILADRPGSIWLLVPTWAAIAVAYRQIVSSREEQRSLRFLYEASRQLGTGARFDAVVTSLLEEVRSRFRADLAELVLVTGHTDRVGFRVTVGPGDSQQAMTSVVLEQAELDLLGSGGAECVTVSENADGALAETLRRRGIRNAMLVRLGSDDAVLGVLLVANRLGQVFNGFGEGERTLFVTVAGQIRVALDNGRLERNVSHLTELKDELRHQAFHDPLTGLANRALFTTKVEEALHEASGAAVLFVDLDDFKTVNDTMGHAAGDELLRQVANLVLPCLGPSDTAARLGGDEFAICLPTAGADDAVATACRVLDALAVPIRVEGRVVRVRASIGIAVDEDRGWDAADLIRCADVAMYMAKVQGKGRYEVFDAGMHEQVKARRGLKVDLQQAVDRGEFTVAYQPIVDVATGRMSGAEALVRWQHPDRGVVMPDEFIGLAEEMGLIGRIGSYVLRDSCLWLARWQRLVPDLTVNVNVSAKQLGQHGFVSDVADVLAATGVRGESVVLEITESAMVGDARGWRETLNRLKDLGVRLAVDDFGTGYSSLSYLNDLPIDVLKVAKPFVDGLDNGAKDAALGQAIIGMGRSLGLDIVAEGVERSAQLDELRRLGCPRAQGYLLGRPMTPEALATRLASGDGGAEPAYGAVIPMMRRASDQRAETS